MKDSVTFALKQTKSTNFWMMFICAFTSLLMFTWRGNIRDSIYKDATANRKFTGK